MPLETPPNILLIDACGIGSVKSARAALAAGADAFRARDLSDASALMLAAHAPCPRLVELLIPLSDLHHADHEKWDALRCAIDAGCPACAHLLLRAGANPLRPDSRGLAAVDLLADESIFGTEWHAVRAECARLASALSEQHSLSEAVPQPARAIKHSPSL